MLVFLATLLGGANLLQPTIESLIGYGANYGPKTIAYGEWWRLLTSMFLHVGILHIAFNMFVLWQAGPFVERLLGNIGFLIAYLVSGLAGAFVSLAWNPYVVSAGASGAIFGVYGALLGFLSIRRASIPSELLSPIRNGALVFLGYNLVYGLISSGTDLAAHLGGLAAGYLCGLALSVPLTTDPMPNRSLRELVIILTAIPLFIASGRALPKPVDLEAEIKQFGAVEKETLSTYNRELRQAQIEKWHDEQLAVRLAKDVLPAWAEERKKLAVLKGLPQRQQRIVSELVNYMDVRRQAWIMLVNALRRHDIDAVKLANAQQEHAVELSRRMATAPR